MCPHHTITAFIVRPHASEEVGTCVPTLYNYRLHCSPTRFRSRVNLCAHTVSYILHCIGHAQALEVEKASLSTV